MMTYFLFAGVILMSLFFIRVAFREKKVLQGAFWGGMIGFFTMLTLAQYQLDQLGVMLETLKDELELIDQELQRAKQSTFRNTVAHETESKQQLTFRR